MNPKIIIFILIAVILIILIISKIRTRHKHKGSIYKTTDGFFYNDKNGKKRWIIEVDRNKYGNIGVVKIRKHKKNDKRIVIKKSDYPFLDHDSVIDDRVSYTRRIINENGNKELIGIKPKDLEKTPNKLKNQDLKNLQDRLFKNEENPNLYRNKKSKKMFKKFGK